MHAGIPTPPLGADPPGSRPPREADSSIRSTSGRYASYWNAFLFQYNLTLLVKCFYPIDSHQCLKRVDSLGVQILSISCSFCEILPKLYVGAPPQAWRPYLGILDPTEWVKVTRLSCWPASHRR